MKNLLFIIIFCLCSSIVFGADWYIDSTCEYNGDGSIPGCALSDGGQGAYNQIPENWTISNDADRLFFKRGCVFDMSRIHSVNHQRININGNNVIVGAYGDGEAPVFINYYDYQDSPPPCYVVEDNVWFCATDNNTVSNFPMILGLGDDWIPGKQRQYHNGGTQAIDEWGEWDYQNHPSDGEPNGFYIYSPNDTNPFDYYGSIHWQNNQCWTVRAQNGNNIKISGLKFYRCFYGVYIGSLSGSNSISGDVVEDCSFDSCFYGVMGTGGEITHVDNVIVRNCYFNNILSTPIYWRGVVNNILVERNRIYNSGWSRSIGGIYYTNPYDTKPNPALTIRYNYCTRYHFGEFYNDGSCYYIDEGGSHSTVSYNIAENTTRAMQDHSGGDNQFYYNVGVDVGNGIVLSAKDINGGNTVEVFNNSFVNCGNFLDFVPDSVRPNTECVWTSTNHGDYYYIKNNLITAAKSGLNCLGVSTDTEDQVINDSSNNLIFGFDNPAINWQTIQPIDLTDKAIFDDPLLTNYHISRTSPARNVGTIISGIHESWPNWVKDIDGDSVTNTPDIGADEFRIRPKIGESIINLNF